MDFNEVFDIAMSYITQEALILIPVLVILGTVLKRTPKVPDWSIPYVILGAGVLFSIAMEGLNPDAVIQGILVAGVSVLGNQLIKQFNKKKEEY